MQLGRAEMTSKTGQNGAEKAEKESERDREWIS